MALIIESGVLLESGLSITPVITVPGAPTIGTATVLTSTSASVTFTAPADNGGATITSYTVTSSPSGITATGSSSPITITGLSAATSYTFTVYATNSVGNSSESSASNSITTSGDTNFSSVALLLMGEGTNNGTTITDSSNNNFTITRAGSGIVTSTTQYTIGSSSIYQPNDVSSSLTTPANNAFILGGGNTTTPWTIDWWMYPVMAQPTVNNYTRFGLFESSNFASLASGSWALNMLRYKSTFSQYDYGLQFFRGTGSAGNYVSGTVQYVNMWANQAWNHIAITYNGTASGGGAIWVNGSLFATFNGESYTGNQWIIGKSNQAAVAYSGYLDAIRYTPGVCRYTTTFTPPQTSSNYT